MGTPINFDVIPQLEKLRHEAFARDNALVWASAWFYTFDTNANVCLSLHVIGSAAALFALRDCPRLWKRARQLASAILALNISLSAVFVKRHSVLGVQCAACVRTGLAAVLWADKAA